MASPVAEEAPAPPGRQKITAAMAEEEHTQATYGRLGGMISGLLGPNTFRADYATGGRSKCQRCHTVFVAEEVRIGKVPPRMRADVTAVRVNWYHPACIFQSFERAAKKTKTIDNVEDVAGFEAPRRGPRGPERENRGMDRAPGAAARFSPDGPEGSKVEGAAASQREG